MHARCDQNIDAVYQKRDDPVLPDVTHRCFHKRAGGDDGGSIALGQRNECSFNCDVSSLYM